MEPKLLDDVEDEIALLIDQFGPDGYHYTDAWVEDMLEQDPVDEAGLCHLLYHIRDTYIKDYGMDDYMQQLAPAPKGMLIDQEVALPTLIWFYSRE